MTKGAVCLESDSVIKLGGKIQIKVGQSWYSTKVERLGEESTFFISPLMSKQITVPLEAGQLYTLSAINNRGLYELDVRFLKKEQSGNISFSKMQVVSELRRNQRRDSFRVDIMLTVSIREPSEEEESEEPTPGYRTRTLNLSESGMLFLANRSYPEDFVLSCDILLNKFGMDAVLKDIQAEVIRSTSPEIHGVLYKIGVNFIEMSKQDKRVLAKFIMMSQRAQQKSNKTRRE